MWLGPPELSLSSQTGVGGQESGHKLSLPKGTQTGNSEEGQPVSWESEALVVWDGKWTSTIAGSLPRVSLAKEKSENPAEGSFPFKLFLTPVSSLETYPTSPVGGSVCKSDVLWLSLPIPCHPV